MGKGDRKTLKGKTYRGSYGNSRAHSLQPAVAGKPSVAKPAAVKKAAAAPKKKSA